MNGTYFKNGLIEHTRFEWDEADETLYVKANAPTALVIVRHNLFVNLPFTIWFGERENGIGFDSSGMIL